MKIYILVFTTFVFTLYAGYSRPPKCQPLSADIHNETLTKLQKETCEKLNAPGAVLYVRFPDGSIWKKAYGLASIDDSGSQKIETDMQFRIASVTKTFIGSAILQLVGENRFHLNDNMEKLLPGFLNYGEKITVKMLLNHSSAIPDYATTDEFTDKWVENFTYNWSKEELFGFIKNEDLLDKPGHEGYYSNSNYYLLGLLIEKYSQKSLPEYLKDKIFDPIGLTNTYFPTTDKLGGKYADGYFDFNENGLFESNEVVTDQNPSAIWAAGMIVSDIHDLSLWIDELFTGTLITPQLQKIRLDMNMQLHGAPEFVKMGLAVASIDGAEGHTGAIPGFTSVLFRYKGADIIALSNCFHTKKDMGSVAETLLQKVKTQILDK